MPASPLERPRSQPPWPPVRAARRAAGSRLARWPVFLLAALGPGVIGLCAQNDAGGMVSYLVTGASHGLGWILPALVLLGLPTFLVQWVALRVEQATRLPYSKVLIRCVGRPLARLEAVVLYALNTLTLVTEFVGMSLALSLAGSPLPLSLAVTFTLVVALTSSSVYPRMEQLLLRTAAGSLAFVPALLVAHRSAAGMAAAFSAHVPDAAFLLLALAGNMLSPWMIYWQQNAAWAGAPRTAGQRQWDLVAGIVALVVMAAMVLLLGALTPGGPSSAASPLVWIERDGGRLTGTLFAVGIFDAGLLSACTVSLSSLWTLREAMGEGARHPTEAPNRGKWLLVHVGTLAVAGAVVLWPGLASGTLAIWTQALGAVWMPVSLVLLGLVARNRRLMGRHAVSPAVQALLALLAVAFAVLSWIGMAGGLSA